MLIKSEHGKDWMDYFQLKNRPDRRNAVISKIKRDGQYQKESFDTKRKIAKNYLAPFLFTDAELEEVLTETESG